MLIVVPVPRELVVLALSPPPGPSACLSLIPEGIESEWEPRMRILCRMLLPVLLSAVFRRRNEATSVEFTWSKKPSTKGRKRKHFPYTQILTSDKEENARRLEKNYHMHFKIKDIIRTSIWAQTHWPWWTHNYSLK